MSTPGAYPPPEPYPTYDGRAGGPGGPSDAERRRPADVTVTIVLIVLLGLLGLLSLVIGLLFTMAADSCIDNDGCYDRVATGVLFIEAAPIVAWVPTTIWAIVRMVRRKAAFWVPLLAIPIWLLLVVAGFTFFDN